MHRPTTTHGFAFLAVALSSLSLASTTRAQVPAQTTSPTAPIAPPAGFVPPPPQVVPPSMGPPVYDVGGNPMQVPRVPVRLTATEDNLTYYIDHGTNPALRFTPRFERNTLVRLCTAPCETALPLGSHGLAIGRGDDTPVRTMRALVVNAPVTVVADYRSRRIQRILLPILGGVLMTSGMLVLVAKGLDAFDDYRDDTPEGVPLIVGGVMAAVGLVTALLGSRDDKVELRLEP